MRVGFIGIDATEEVVQARHDSREYQREVLEQKPDIALFDAIVTLQGYQVTMLEEVVQVGIPRYSIRLVRC